MSLTEIAHRRNRRFVKRREQFDLDAAPVAVGYIRVSTDEQDLGPEAQERAIAEYCTTHGCVLAGVFVDKGVSGTTDLDRRPGFRAAYEAIQQHGARLFVVAKLDRLARDVMIASMAERFITRAGCEFRSAAGEGSDSNDPASQLMKIMVTGFAAYERQMIAFRTKVALKVKIDRGERVGAVPLGYAQVEKPGERKNGDGVLRCLVPETHERDAACIARYLESHNYGLRSTSRILSELGYVSRKGTPYHQQQVKRLLLVSPVGVDEPALHAVVNAHLADTKPRQREIVPGTMPLFGRTEPPQAGVPTA